MKIEKPGKYKQRDGRVAEVAGVRGDVAVGYNPNGRGTSWEAGDGRFFTGHESSADLIAPHLEPRLRAWKAEEVPLLATVVHKENKHISGAIVGKSGGIIRISGVIEVTCDDLLNDWLQTNGSPCGVEEAV